MEKDVWAKNEVVSQVGVLFRCTGVLISP